MVLVRIRIRNLPQCCSESGHIDHTLSKILLFSFFQILVLLPILKSKSYRNWHGGVKDICKELWIRISVAFCQLPVHGVRTRGESG